MAAVIMGFHLLTNECQPPQKGEQGTEKPWSGSEGISPKQPTFSAWPPQPAPPTQKEVLISNQTTQLKFGLPVTRMAFSA